MDIIRTRALLEEVASGQVSPDAAVSTLTEQLRDLPYEEMGFAKVDHHRALRQGFPEVIFCQGKTPEQVAAIAGRLQHAGATLLASRADEATFRAVSEQIPTATYNLVSRLIYAPGRMAPLLPGRAGVVCAGTSDLPVAEEAAGTLEAMGADVERVYDVGVAGLHRLLAQLPILRQCDVLIAVAGMEGAMPSVLAGLVDMPVVAVPTSVGYGANFGGLSALLGMLNSCANGIAVVNIDNGFGAAAFAATILQRLERSGGAAAGGTNGEVAAELQGMAAQKNNGLRSP